MSDKENMKLDMVTNIASLLMEDNKQMSMEQALFTVFKSDTYRLLQQDETTFYYQSPRYVYSYLKTELATGKVG